MIEAVTAADRAGEPLLVLAGGSNVVVADEGFPGTVVRIATRGVARDGAAPRGRRRRAVGPARGRLRGRRPRRRGVPGGHPGLGRRDADPERRRLRPGGGRDDPRRARARPRRRDGAIARPRGLRLHLPLERVQARAGPLGGARRALRAGAPRSARRRSATPSWRGPWGSRSARAPRSAAVREAVLALRRGKGMVLDPDDADTVSRGLVLHQPGARRRRLRRAAGARRAATGPRRAPAGLATRTTGRSRPRPHGSSSAPASAAATATRTGIAISAKHTLALTNRGAGTTAELVALAREIADGVQDGLRGRARARAGARRAALVSA